MPINTFCTCEVGISGSKPHFHHPGDHMIRSYQTQSTNARHLRFPEFPIYFLLPNNPQPAASRLIGVVEMEFFDEIVDAWDCTEELWEEVEEVVEESLALTSR
ncbi:hypothetical protein I7I48_03212 [Histoplasma ohiense]|nr:hypothetical protein I7I48_03212 [Histoplasma ohiense (nom. inval.)]